jgi:2-succinyl-5-enolpyruvyl-6-hydroxy-3-cyclohexene-1-carboxylate synthase
VALLGDLALVHDCGGLTGIGARGVDLTIVVLDDDGGAIFSFLAQADQLERDSFERLFGTPHGLDLVALASAHGVRAQRIKDVERFAPALRASIERGGVEVLVVEADRTRTVGAHRELWAKVSAAVPGSVAPHGEGAAVPR